MPRNPEVNNSSPWYKEPWAWFVFSPLVLVVVVCTIFVSIAFLHQDDLVADDYYEVGKMINREFVPEREAKAMHLSVLISFTDDEVHVQSNQSLALSQTLSLFLSHPARADLDRSLLLQRQSEYIWTGALPSLPQGHWYLRLSAYDNENSEHKVEIWRLQGEIQTTATLQSVRLN